MNLPHWVEKHIETVQPDFTGQIVIECWSGGVTRMDIKICLRAPEAGELNRDERK